MSSFSAFNRSHAPGKKLGILFTTLISIFWSNWTWNPHSDSGDNVDDDENSVTDSDLVAIDCFALALDGFESDLGFYAPIVH